MNPANIVHLEAHPSSSIRRSELTISLYPYQSQEIKVAFVYGADFKRQKYQIFLTDIGEEAFYLVGGFLLLAAALVCFVRRKLQLRRDGLNSAMLDVYIAFFGGGNLRVHNKFERWMFEVLLIGSFFLMTFWLDAVLFPSFLIQDQSIKTFDQLAEANIPIYMLMFNREDNNIFTESLRSRSSRSK